MHKQAISVSLDPSNVLWLRAQAVSSGGRSISEILDRLVREARTGGSGQEEIIRSVVGTIQIVESDSDLSTADAAVRALFPLTLNRQSTRQRRMPRPSKGGRSSVSKGRKRG